MREESAESFEVQVAGKQGMIQHIRAASAMTNAVVIAMFIPILFVYVFVKSVVYIRSCCKLRAEHPEIDEQTRALVRRRKRVRKALAKKVPAVKTLLEFKEASLAFWVLLAVPFFYAGVIAIPVMMLT